MKIKSRAVFSPRFPLILLAAIAALVSADVSPDAAELLLAKGDGARDAWIANVFYSCVNGNAFAMVRNGKPDNQQDYDTVETEHITVYVPKDMTFKDNIPKIVTFPRRTGYRDVGVPNFAD